MCAKIETLQEATWDFGQYVKTLIQFPLLSTEGSSSVFWSVLQSSHLGVSKMFSCLFSDHPYTSGIKSVVSSRIIHQIMLSLSGKDVWNYTTSVALALTNVSMEASCIKIIQDTLFWNSLWSHWYIFMSLGFAFYLLVCGLENSDSCTKR